MSESKNSTELVTRKTLVQTNATIIAGMLIFLTIGLDKNPDNANFIFTFVVFGFLFLVISMLLCFATGDKGRLFNDKKLCHIFNFSELTFMMGISFLFLTVTLILFDNLFNNAVT